MVNGAISECYFMDGEWIPLKEGGALDGMLKRVKQTQPLSRRDRFAIAAMDQINIREYANHATFVKTVLAIADNIMIEIDKEK